MRGLLVSALIFIGADFLNRHFSFLDRGFAIQVYASESKMYEDCFCQYASC